MAFRVKVLACDEGGTMPKRHTGEGENISPAIEWEDAPSGTRSFALIVDDPDAPAGTWTHWLLWDIPGSLHGLPEGFLPGSLGTSGVNDFGSEGYGGPMPPVGHGPHRYQFKLYALDTGRLMLHVDSSRAHLDKALRGHDLAEVWTTVKYERQ